MPRTVRLELEWKMFASCNANDAIVKKLNAQNNDGTVCSPAAETPGLSGLWNAWRNGLCSGSRADEALLG